MSGHSSHWDDFLSISDSSDYHHMTFVRPSFYQIIWPCWFKILLSVPTRCEVWSFDWNYPDIPWLERRRVHSPCWHSVVRGLSLRVWGRMPRVPFPNQQQKWIVPEIRRQCTLNVLGLESKTIIEFICILIHPHGNPRRHYPHRWAFSTFRCSFVPLKVVRYVQFTNAAIMTIAQILRKLWVWSFWLKKLPYSVYPTKVWMWYLEGL